MEEGQGKAAREAESGKDTAAMALSWRRWRYRGGGGLPLGRFRGDGVLGRGLAELGRPSSAKGMFLNIFPDEQK